MEPNPLDVLTVAKDCQELGALLARLQNFPKVVLPKTEPAPGLEAEGNRDELTPLPTRTVYFRLNKDEQWELTPLCVEKIVNTLISSGNMLETLMKDKASPAAS